MQNNNNNSIPESVTKPDIASLPFLTRDMLKFGREASIELIVRSQASVAAALTVRSVNRENVSEFTHTTVATGVVTTTTHKIADIPIMISVVDDGANFRQGSCFVTLALRVNGEIVYELTSGFVYNFKSLSWPANQGNDSMPGRGRIRQFVGSDPAAGDEIFESVPAGRVWHILALSFQLVTSATVASRRVHVAFSSGVNLNIDSHSNTDHTASLTRNYSCAQFGALLSAANDNDIMIPIPQNIYLVEDDALQTETLNIQTTDNYSPAIVLIEEFFTTPA